MGIAAVGVNDAPDQTQAACQFLGIERIQRAAPAGGCWEMTFIASGMGYLLSMLMNKPVTAGYRQMTLLRMM